MQIDYGLTQRDFNDSFAAHRNRNVFSKWMTRVLVSFCFLMLAIFLLNLIIRPDAHDTRNLMPYLVLTFLWIGITRILPQWSARKQFSRQPGAHGPRTVLLDDTGVHWHWNGGSSDIAWKNYVRGLEGKTQFLLYTSPACFNIIPKRALTPEGLLELRALLKQYIPAS